MTSNKYITNSIQSAAKLAVLIALIAFSASANGQQITSLTPTATNDPNHVFTSVEDMLSLIPSTVDPRPGGSWNAAALEQASASLRSAVNGKAARLTVQVEFVSKMGTAGYRLVVPRQQLPEPHPYGAMLSLLFKEDKADKLSTLTKGQVVTVEGSITTIRLSAQGPTMASLYVSIRDADIVGSPAGAAAVSASTPSTPDPTANSKPSSAAVSGSTPTAPANTPKPSEPISPKEHLFQTVEEILSFIPGAIETRPGGQWNKAALEQASTFLRFAVKDKAAKLTVLVNTSRKAPTGYHLYVGSSTLPEPHPYITAYMLSLSDDKEGKLTALKYGQPISIIGRITDCYLQLHGTVAALHIDMQDADVSDTPPPIPKIVVSVTAKTTDSTEGGTSAPESKTLVLARGWNSPMQGGTSTLEDLARLFNDVAKPDMNLAGDNSIMVFQNVPYLTPIREAVKSLDLTGRLASKVLIACPGLPNDSLYYYAVDGLFEGHFNRIYLVVDRADQLVSVQLVDEHPRKSAQSANDQGWHTYNFINYRTKAMNTMRIEHLIDCWSDNRWFRSSTQYNQHAIATRNKWTVLRVSSLLLGPIHDTHTHTFGDLKALEEVEWYVPRPIAELILTCVQKSIK